MPSTKRCRSSQRSDEKAMQESKTKLFLRVTAIEAERGNWDFEMTEQENCVPTTCSSSKKRASSESAIQPQQLPNLKRRVVLGELTNSLNISLLAQNSDRSLKKPNSDLKNKEEEEEEEGGEFLDKTEKISVSSVDPPKRVYSSSIYQHLHALEMEVNRRPVPNYMEKVQNDVSPNMRAILVDWLVEVSEEYKLVSDTLYLTVSYVDRVLSSFAISRSKLQLVGVSCMLIASKYEEICPPHAEDFCYVTDNTFTKDEVLDMERNILKFLNFEMSTPTSKNFLRILNGAVQENSKSSDMRFEFLGCYLAELSLLDYICVRFLPSVIAASAIFLSRFTLQPEVHPWTLALQCCSSYKPSDLKDCVLAIHDLQLNRKGSSFRSVRDKYKQQKFNCVATLSPPLEIPAVYFEPINK
nr:G2/mitotic-specific cyclin C13-1-like [Ziziphus jujuba var. spinosa]